MDWLGKAKISFTCAASPLGLRRTDGSPTDVAEVCRESTPPCQLNPLLFNGHVQTMWTAASADPGPPVFYRREIFDADHAVYTGAFAVDFAVAAHADTDPSLPPRTAFFADGDFAKLGSDDARPMLIVLHGLSGGSYEIYLRHCIAPLLEAGAGDWAVCVGQLARLCPEHRHERCAVQRARHVGREAGRRLGQQDVPEPAAVRPGLLPGRQHPHQRTCGRPRGTGAVLASVC